jgi:MFS family permease
MVRGRVMALYMAIFMGGTPFGAPLIGWIGDTWGPRWTIAIGTIMVGLSLAVVALWFTRRNNVAVTFQTQSRPRLQISLSSPSGSVGDGSAIPTSPEVLR